MVVELKRKRRIIGPLGLWTFPIANAIVGTESNAQEPQPKEKEEAEVGPHYFADASDPRYPYGYCLNHGKVCLPGEKEGWR